METEAYIVAPITSLREYRRVAASEMLSALVMTLLTYSVDESLSVKPTRLRIKCARSWNVVAVSTSKTLACSVAFGSVEYEAANLEDS